MQQLFNAQAQLLTDFQSEPFYERQCFDQITLDNHATAIVGARGVGKTTLLLHLTLKHQETALYISADSLYFLENSLYDLAEQLYTQTNITLLCIDEIHKYQNWEQELKNIIDTFRKIKILFTGSSMIDIIHGKFDLSRRVTLHHIQGFSFREYLAFHHNCNHPVTELEHIIHHHQKLVRKLNMTKPIQLFHEYLRIGYYPFFKSLSKDSEKYQAIQNVIQKTIYEDIAAFYALKTPTLMLIEKLYQYVVYSSPGELNAYKVAKTLNKDFASISTYLKILKEAGLIRYLYTSKSGKAMLRNPEKMYPDNTNMIYASQSANSDNDLIIGKVRETFALASLQNAGLNAFYNTQGDLQVNNFIFEIGGKNKSMKQIANTDKGYLLCDNILIGDKYKIPLYLLGFLY